MNKAIKFFTAGAMLLSTTFIQVNAQDGAAKKPEMRKEFTQKTPEERATIHVEKLSEKLNLTEQQKKQVYDLRLQQMKEKKALHEQQKAQRQKAHEDIKKILTPEQLKKLEELKAQKKEEFKGKKGGQGYKPHPYRGGEKPAPKN